MKMHRPIMPGHPLVADAMQRLAVIGARAGHPDWTPPAVSLSASALDQLIGHHDLAIGEALIVALLAAAECDAAVARRIADLQAPVGGARLLAGLAVALANDDGLTVAGLFGGRATGAGLITWGAEDVPLPERTLSMPVWIAAVVGGGTALPPGVNRLFPPPVKLSLTERDRLAAKAALLRSVWSSGQRPPLLALRAACPAEALAMTQELAQAAKLAPVLIEGVPAPGFAAWLRLTGSVAVARIECGPGESRDLSAYDALDTPLIVAAGTHGQLMSARPQFDHKASIPDETARRQLWQDWGLNAEGAQQAASRYRQSAGRIAEIGRGLSGVNKDASFEQMCAVMDSSNGRIDGLARRASARVERKDIVLPPDLASALDRLRDRILMRNQLHEGLGPTIRARYLPGVRALMTGQSGTGKTLAAHWLAGEAGLPLYRVDLSALTSKWIGETEKNLSQLLDAAEQGDVLLFFDEADALFGARTDVSDAHDRHANAQTNFLLQRIEDYEGVALLATNSRDRFDPAFVRRLDMVLDFPLPNGAARRLLWDRHLGEGHAIAAARLDQIASSVELAGGHVRNVVLAASARAKADARLIDAADLDAAIAEEYAKLGRTAPPL